MTDFFTTMLHTWMPEDTLLVGARNILYKLEAHPELRLTQTMRWASLDKEVDNCLVKGKSHTDCQNYIKVLQQFKVTLDAKSGSHSSKNLKLVTTRGLDCFASSFGRKNGKI